MRQTKQKSKTATKKHHTYAVIGMTTAVLAFYVMFVTSQQIQRGDRPFTPQPTWVQNFTTSNSTSIDPLIWHYSTDPDTPGYNNEKQAYTSMSQNIHVEPNTGLIIEARKEKYEYPNDRLSRTFEYTSGRIDTRHSLNFEYGKVEATIKLPKGAGVWPAFWLLSANEPHTRVLDDKNAFTSDKRFYMKDGEIDIMEYYGSPEGQLEATMHTYNRSHAKTVTVSDYAEQFHTYAVEIEPTKITWTIDNNPYFSYNKSSDKPDEWPVGSGNQFYIILNLAMGGDGGGKIDDATAPWRMVVQNVKFYDYVSR